MATVPIFAPDGTLGDIPQDQLKAAISAGAKPGVTIKAPDGSLGVVPADRYQEAAKAGGQVVPLKDQETQHPGFWAHAADMLGGLLHPSGFSPYPGMGQEEKSAAAGQAYEQDQARQKPGPGLQEGRGLAYRALAPVAQSVGVDVPGMEANAAAGDVGGVAAGAAVPAATILALEAVRHGAGAASDAVKTAAKSETGGKLAASAKVLGASADELPGIGSTIRAVKKLNKLRDIWGEQPSYPGAPLPEAPPAEVGQARGLATGARTAPEPAAALSKVKVAQPAEQAAPSPEATPEAAAPQPTAAPEAPAQVPTDPKTVERLLNEALGGKPLQKGIPLKSQGTAPKLPEGFTPVDSSAVRGYKYDAGAQELSTVTNNGQVYTHGEVTPEEAQAFADADSKGKAWNGIRQNHVLVKQNGLPVKPVARSIVTDPSTGKPEFSDVVESKAAKTPEIEHVDTPTDDLTAQLQKSLEMVKAKKGGTLTKADPSEIVERWKDQQTEGMGPQQTEEYIQKLADSYKSGRPVEPVLETRDASGKITGVDGRARAEAAKRAGIKEIPIMIRQIGRKTTVKP